ncbi:MAG: tetratricopeptide repeat protein [Pseudomonadota bacterium]
MIKARKRNIPIAVALFFALSLPPLVSVSSVAGEDTGDLMTRALRLREDDRQDEALKLFETILQEEPDNYQALLNAGFIHFRQGWLYSDKDGEKDHYFKMLEYANRAVDQHPMEYEAKLIHLVARAKTAGYLSPGSQVRIARDLRQELEALMAYRKNDPNLIYMLSWLNFKVGRVGSVEKLLASILFGGLPDNLTTGNAIELMQQAIELRPDYSIYYFDLGLFQQRLGQLEEARSLFEKVLSMAPGKSEEVVYRQRAEERLKDLERQKGASN